MRKNKSFRVWIVLGFIVLYVVSMGIATYLLKNRYMKEFELQYYQYLNHLRNSLDEEFKRNDLDGSYISDMFFSCYRFNSILQYVAFPDNAAYQQYSAVYYKNSAGVGKIYRMEPEYFVWDHGEDGLYGGNLQDIMSKEDILEMVNYYQMVRQARKVPLDAERDEYEFYVRINSEDGIPVEITLLRTVWEKLTDNETEIPILNPLTGVDETKTFAYGENVYEYVEYHAKEYEVVYTWLSPDMENISSADEYFAADVFLPYGNGSEKDVERWLDNSYLQNAMDLKPGDEKMLKETYETQYDLLGDYPVFDLQYSRVVPCYGSASLPDGYLVLATQVYPWRAAVDTMRWVYIACALLMSICIGIILLMIDRTEKQRVRMEENRKNYTNALAHEMKTPLGIIRGMAENMKADSVPEKREYYLEQIVSQTEAMDHLVIEMIDMSKLDSEALVLQKEQVDMKEILQKQLEKLEPFRLSKNIQIEWKAEEQFCVIGDRKYLAKAVFNLLDNAIRYSDFDGSIKISVKETGCAIENPGELLPQEKLQHIFEVSDHNGKLSIGLYISRRILELNGLDLSINNSETGIIAEIVKK